MLKSVLILGKGSHKQFAMDMKFLKHSHNFSNTHHSVKQGSFACSREGSMSDFLQNFYCKIIINQIIKF